MKSNPSQQPKATELQKQLSELQNQIKKAEEDLDDLQKDYQTRKRALDDELQHILIRNSDAVVRLKELQGKEESIRSGIAEELRKLDRQRKLAKKDTYMKL